MKSRKSNNKKDIYLAKLRKKIYETNDYNITEIKKEIAQEERQIDGFEQTLIVIALNDKRKNDKEIKRIINQYVSENLEDEEKVKK